MPRLGSWQWHFENNPERAGKSQNPKTKEQCVGGSGLPARDTAEYHSALPSGGGIDAAIGIALWTLPGPGRAGQGRAIMTLKIQRLADEQIEAAKAVVIAGCLEFFGHPPQCFADMDAVTSQYREPSGTFLALMDGPRVVGTGAIRRLDAETCELKRMWFLPEYRGKGHGTRMCERLFEFARAAGYKRVRLDTASELKAANRLYQRLGFRPIERYNDGPADIFMEMSL
jgi:putative acetyltransferase